MSQTQPMKSIAIQMSQISLRVRDVRRSADFYAALFGPGLPPDTTPPNGRVGRDWRLDCGVTLVQGLPRGAEPIGLEGLSFTVPNTTDVDAVYATAVARGYPALKPAAGDGAYYTYIFDPDGYRIEVLTHVSVSEPFSGGELSERQANGLANGCRPRSVFDANGVEAFAKKS